MSTARTFSRLFFSGLVAACVVTVWLLWQRSQARIAAAHELALLMIRDGNQEKRLAGLRARLVETEKRRGGPLPVSWDGYRWSELRRLVDEAKRNQSVRPLSPSYIFGSKALAKLMENPEYARLYAAVVRSHVSPIYLKACSYAGVTADKLDAVLELLDAQMMLPDDVNSAARKMGLSEEETLTVRLQASTKLEDDIKALVGEDAYDRIQKYRKAYDSTQLVDSLETRLSYSEEPLSPAQARKLFKCAAGNGSKQFVLLPDPRSIDSLVAKAQAFLSDAQIVALRQVAIEANYGRTVYVDGKKYSYP